jgi:hypothetical protein
VSIHACARFETQLAGNPARPHTLSKSVILRHSTTCIKVRSRHSLPTKPRTRPDLGPTSSVDRKARLIKERPSRSSNHITSSPAFPASHRNTTRATVLTLFTVPRKCGGGTRAGALDGHRPTNCQAEENDWIIPLWYFVSIENRCLLVCCHETVSAVTTDIVRTSAYPSDCSR